ncbi:hypothetical protein [Paractinoplanes rishiriensis]|uniref:Transmembrane protein n=1 Tax=Paractinoplanes rishiriensis TaxID=1050105 RepID=A0A919KCK5_9ACTN|nr:hypothetical protein [Actinoplanes rishiriensis]GIF01172.1 hypothetical protein Ari01nite_86360 [Actinoplanes rishiriensis]
MGVNEQRQHRPDETTSRSATARVGVAQRLIEGAPGLAEARQLYDDLVAAGISPDRIMLVGRDLTPATRESDRWATVSVAGKGALPGLITGALVGGLLRLTGLVDPTVSDGWLIFAAALLGTVLGAIVAVISHGMLATRRAAARASQVNVSHVDLLVDAELADHAARLLREQAPEHPAGNGR